MIIKKTLLQITLTLTLFSTVSMATDLYSDTKFQKTIPSRDTLLITADKMPECSTITSSTSTIWNIGEICFASDLNSSTTSSSVANAQSKSIYSKALLNLLKDSHKLGAECITNSGSAASNEDLGGFCLTADLNASIANSANFSVANELPAVVGMQFLQVIFKDGSTLGGSASIGAECLSAGGSTSAPENAEGFCLASDLSRSTAIFANLAVANGMPAVGLQYVQILFADSGASASSSTNTECVSIGGSSAATGSAGGFCLASDLSTSTAGFTNFSVAHDVAVSDLQFLQVTFDDASPLAESLSSPGAGAPIGAECISVDGSIAAIDNANGFCLISDLVESPIDSADITFANNLPASSMQFLQVKFANSGELLLPSSFDSTAECVSDGGSTAAAGNPGGFCLVSDLINSTIESANISVANDLPVISLEFLQVPSKDAASLVAAVPMGVVVSAFKEFPFTPTPNDIAPPKSSTTLKDLVGKRTPFFHISNQTNGIEQHSTPYWRTYSNIGLWVGR